MTEEAKPPTPQYSNASLILCGLVVAGIIAFVVYAKMEDDRIYGPVRESRQRVEAAERAVVDTELQVAMDTVQRRAEANLARIEGREPVAATGPSAGRRRMTADLCLASIVGTADAIGQAPAYEINNAERRVARFEFPDGVVRITCADGERIVSHSPR